MAPYEPIWWARTEVGYEDEKRRDQFVALPESLAKTALSWRAVLKVATWGDTCDGKHANIEHMVRGILDREHCGAS